MSTEIEAKFIVPGQRAYDGIRALSRLGSYELLDGQMQSVHDEYLDTPGRALLAAGYACRKRENEGVVVLTIKSMAAPRNDMHRREELEVTLPADSPLVPDAWPPSPVRDKVRELGGEGELQVLFELRQQRFVRPVVDGERLVATASLDDVSVVSVGTSRHWFELEVELAAGGTETDLVAMCGWIRATHGLNPAPDSKFERALELAGRTTRREGRRARRRLGGPAAGQSVVLDAPAEMSGELPFIALAGMGYKAHVRRQVTDHVTFYDTHDGTYMNKGFTVTYSRTGGTWRVREDGEVVAEEAGPQSALPLEGALGRALGSIPAAHPTLPLLEATLVQSDYSLAGFAANSLRIRARQWTFHSPIQATAPRTMLRLVASGPPSTLEYFSSVLRERLGFLPARASVMARGLALLGLSAPGAGAPEEFRVSPRDSVAQACRRIFRGEAWRMKVNAPGAIRDLDPEFVHDLRVATRRARSASRLFAFILDPDHLQKLRGELRWIARLLGGVRDLDVLAARLETQVRITASETGFSHLLRERLQAKRDRALAELVPALQSDRFAGLLTLLESTGESIPSLFEAFGQDAATPFARKRIDKAFRKLSPWIDRPAEGLSDIELHRVRILFKRLRYTCDFFRSLPGEDMGSLIGGFVVYQDCLGLHQDAATAVRILTELLGEVPPEGRSEELLLSMGAMLQVQRDIQRIQRQKFSRKWSSAAELPALWRKLREPSGVSG